MRKGYLAHYCCCGNELHKRSIISTSDNLLCGIEQFSSETPHTIFYDGLLIVVTPSFEPHCNTFIEQLQQLLDDNTQLPITEAILHCDIYKSHRASLNEPCLIYSITPIDWSQLRPAKKQGMRIELIER